MTQRLIPLGLKGEPGPERQRGLQFHAIEHDLEIGTRKANAVDTPEHLRAEALGNLVASISEIPDGVLPLLPIDPSNFSVRAGGGTAITAVRVLSALLAVRRRAIAELVEVARKVDIGAGGQCADQC